MYISEINAIFAKSPVPYECGDWRNADKNNSRDFRKELPTAEDVYEAAKLAGVKTGNLDNADRKTLDYTLNVVQDSVLRKLAKRIENQDYDALVLYYGAMVLRANTARPHDSGSVGYNMTAKMLNCEYCLMDKLKPAAVKMVVDSAYIRKMFADVGNFEHIIKGLKLHFGDLLPEFAKRIESGGLGYNDRMAIDAAIAYTVRQPDLSAWANAPF